MENARHKILSKLSPEGRAWLESALNGFSDYRMKVGGIPDMYAGLTTMRVTKKQINLSHASGNAWDCMVFLNPFPGGVARMFRPGLRSAPGVSLNQVHYKTTPPAGTEVELYDLIVIHVDEGEILLPNAATTAWAPAGLESTGINFRAAVNTSSRLAFCAVEGVNTSSALNNTGGCMVGLHKPEFEPVVPYVSKDDDSVNPDMTQLYRVATYPAHDKLNWSVYPDVKAWRASEGFYVNARIDNSDWQAPVHAVPTLVEHTRNFTLAGALMKYNTGTGTAPQMIPSFSNPVLSPVVFLTGLHPDATFQITVCAGEELKAAADDSHIHFATPSAAYDPKALELYSKLARELPVGCPVGDNDSGDWYKLIWSTALRILPTLGLALDPVLPGAGVAAAMTEKVVRGLQQAKRQRKKASNTKQKTRIPPPGKAWTRT